MRKTVVALLLTLAATLGAYVPSVAAATSSAKIVIIVGAVHGATDTYRSRADAAYAEAIKHSTNVVKVYSPNATWNKVKEATTGASIVIYFGHGNGWPSPYTFDPNYTTKDGFGLNAQAGQGDHNNVYYGEPYVASLDLAPNALVMLHHLCYASGNSEGGHAEPTVDVARQRIDNYAAGFLKSNARAVIADGHRGPASYLADLFTTDRTIEEIWRTNPGANGNVTSFESVRTPGATAYMDPEQPESGFYRSFVGDPTMTSTDLRGSAIQPYGTTPFVDIASTSFADDIQWLYEQAITGGCADSRYCPGSSVTRGQMASFLARALDLPAASKDYFDDDDGTTHEDDINRIAEAGITGGCDDGRYCHRSTVTRAQMASFLARALDLPAASKDYFDDDDGTTHEDDINRIAEAAITGGCADGRYCVGSGTTRGQMAAFLHRALGN